MSKEHALNSVDVPARPAGSGLRSLLARNVPSRNEGRADVKKSGREVVNPLSVVVGLVVFLVVGVCGGLFVGASAVAQGPMLTCNEQMCNLGPDDRGPLRCWDEPGWGMHCAPVGPSCESGPCKAIPK